MSLPGTVLSHVSNLHLNWTSCARRMPGCLTVHSVASFKRSMSELTAGLLPTTAAVSALLASWQMVRCESFTAICSSYLERYNVDFTDLI